MMLPSRRRMLSNLGSGVGMVGLAGVMADAGLAGAAPSVPENPLAPRAPHFAPKAKHVIHLFMNGGPSQVDTFDPKPELARHAGKPMPAGHLSTERKTGNCFPSAFKFHKSGQSGVEVSEIFPEIAKRIDDICVIRSMHTNVPNHEPSLLMMTSGNLQPIRPSMGAWLSYGLGTENRNLPGFVVLCPGKPVVGPQLWGSSFLPGAHQGCHIQNLDPQKVIDHIRNGRISASSQRGQLDLINAMNREHRDARSGDDQLEARIQSFEMAFRMQTEASDAFDVSREPASTRALYGTGAYADSLIIARRLVERGVRTVQVFTGSGQPWDDHGNVVNGHRTKAQTTDKPIAALLADLKGLGLLDETLVLWGGEFGRTPTTEGADGRDHNNHGFSVWLAGGGVKGGMAYGATDDFGFAAARDKVHVHDLHATMLHLMGINHEKLTYRYSGRDFRLTDVHGTVVREILA
jgi:hypothetical protein